MKDISRNLTMLFDFYEITMGNGYFKSGYADRIVYFDLFYRDNPDNGGYAVAAGLEQIIEYIENLSFDGDDIEYLRSKGYFDEEFLNYLSTFRFTGDIWAVPEGTVVFPGEPLITVRAKAIEAQFIETYMLLMINHQSLIATKAARITRAARGRAVSEFGSRRAQGADAAILGARAAYIGGCNSTACAIADQVYGVPATGTMAHSWVQMFDDEYTAFKTYCEIYPNNATLLIDTYNVLNSGVPNAIKVFNEVLKPLGITKCGVRLDSGDITYLTKKVRKMLDDAGWNECKIIVSNSLDEYIIREIIRQGAEVDAFGVGERLITAKSHPVFGAVYKLCAVENENGEIIPRIKISENVGKITTPHFKKVYRLRGRDTGKAEADLICLYDETVDDSMPIELFDPEYTWKRKTLENYTAEELLVPIFKNGELVYEVPTLEEIRAHHQKEMNGMWDEVKRFTNPHNYYVDLSQKLWDIKNGLLQKAGTRDNRK
ncbi:MAG: nicotinate phosphoribosyltransferase [Ruminococcaceae bacterium]|nr:nicotinate phosphoribosyltransferase [Oscillospiraceae bacterium]